MKTIRIILVLAVIILCFCSLKVGEWYGERNLWQRILFPDKLPVEITGEEAMEYLIKASQSHEQAILNGDGNVEFHQGCIDRYNAIVHYILKGR